MSTPAPSLSPLNLATGNPSGKSAPLSGQAGDGPSSFAKVLRHTQNKAPDRTIQPVPVEREPAASEPAATDASDTVIAPPASVASAPPRTGQDAPRDENDIDALATSGLAVTVAATPSTPGAFKPTPITLPTLPAETARTTAAPAASTVATVATNGTPIIDSLVAQVAAGKAPFKPTPMTLPAETARTTAAPAASTVATIATNGTPIIDSLVAQVAAGKAPFKPTPMTLPTLPAETARTATAPATTSTVVTPAIDSLLTPLVTSTAPASVAAKPLAVEAGNFAQRPTIRELQALIKQARAQAAVPAAPLTTSADSTATAGNTSDASTTLLQVPATALDSLALNSSTANGSPFQTPQPAPLTLSTATLPQAGTGDFLLADPANTRSQDFPDEIGTRLSWLAERNIGHAQIKVAPPELGAVDVRLKIDGHQVHLDFSSPHAEVRAALEASLPRLRDMFQAQGMTLVQADVGQQAHDRGGEFSAQRGEASLFGGDADDDSTLTGTADIDTGLTRLRNGLLDEFA